VTNEIQQTESCSECGSKAGKDGKRYAEYMETLDLLFPKVQNTELTDIFPVSSDGNLCVTVTNIAGECASYKYNPEQTIDDLKKNVMHTMGIPFKQQILQYNSLELKVRACLRLLALK
jgi:hypothetical protein